MKVLVWDNLKLRFIEREACEKCGRNPAEYSVIIEYLFYGEVAEDVSFRACSGCLKGLRGEAKKYGFRVKARKITSQKKQKK